MSTNEKKKYRKLSKHYFWEIWKKKIRILNKDLLFKDFQFGSPYLYYSCTIVGSKALSYNTQVNNYWAKIKGDKYLLGLCTSSSLKEIWDRTLIELKPYLLDKRWTVLILDTKFLCQ